MIALLLLLLIFCCWSQEMRQKITKTPLVCRPHEITQEKKKGVQSPYLRWPGLKVQRHRTLTLVQERTKRGKCPHLPPQVESSPFNFMANHFHWQIHFSLAWKSLTSHKSQATKNWTQNASLRREDPVKSGPRWCVPYGSVFVVPRPDPRNWRRRKFCQTLRRYWLTVNDRRYTFSRWRLNGTWWFALHL